MASKIDYAGETLAALERIEKLTKEYSKSIESLNKISGGFGLGLTKFGTVNAKLEILADRLDLNQKQNKQLLAYETTFSSVLKGTDKNLQKLLGDFGPKIMGETIKDALSAGGPILADALELGNLMTAVGKDPAKMFKFLNEFKSITGFGVAQQKMLVSNLRDNFARQDAVISALEKLIDTMQEAAGLDPDIPENVSRLINDFSKQFPGLEDQFAKLFKSYFADPTIARGYLGPELQEANRVLVQKLMKGTLTKEEALSFIEQISNSPEIKARQKMFSEQAVQTGLVQDSITGLSSMLGDFVKEARQTNAAVDTVTDQLKSSDLVKIDKIPTDQLLIETLKQLDITLDKVNSRLELSKDDFAYLQQFYANLGLDFSYSSLPDGPIKLDDLASKINSSTEQQIEQLRKEESKISDAYTTYSEVKDLASLFYDIYKGFKEVAEAIKDATKKKLGEDCENPMYVKLCTEGVRKLDDVTSPIPTTGIPKVEPKTTTTETSAPQPTTTHVPVGVPTFSPTGAGSPSKKDPVPEPVTRPIEIPVPEPVTRPIEIPVTRPIEIPEPVKIPEKEPVKIPEKEPVTKPIKIPEKEPVTKPIEIPTIPIIPIPIIPKPAPTQPAPIPKPQPGPPAPPPTRYPNLPDPLQPLKPFNPLPEKPMQPYSPPPNPQRPPRRRTTPTRPRPTTPRIPRMQLNSILPWGAIFDVIDAIMTPPPEKGVNPSRPRDGELIAKLGGSNSAVAGLLANLIKSVTPQEKMIAKLLEDVNTSVNNVSKTIVDTKTTERYASTV